ncbi:WD repeat-containing protein 43 [Juglans microcarpa x Juglans regia]|uniref:WD repeat-containing protein 43 n=1 Tax=Juglans microcarpa x Juglans regia TaxID=2249226 RepID=UPI001B7D99BB|nr:WD repeat-containing protein 43 [Juglans microcarpa x Juglans regia]
MPAMKRKKKSRGEAVDGVLVNEEDPNEPTMGEKLASLNLTQNDKSKSDGAKIDDDKSGDERPEPSSLLEQPPSLDSVQVLLKQALRADDRALLLDCLYNRDEKVIAKSVSLLNAADVLKLLQSLVSNIQSRGAILACALPWLKSVLLQHASGIMSQESSLLALNSLFQLIESRVSTFESAIQLSSCLDILYTGVVDDEVEENGTTVPVVYEDKDESDEEESEDAMETDQDREDEEASDEAFDGVDDIEGSDGITD